MNRTLLRTILFAGTMAAVVLIGHTVILTQTAAVQAATTSPSPTTSSSPTASTSPTPKPSPTLDPVKRCGETNCYANCMDDSKLGKDNPNFDCYGMCSLCDGVENPKCQQKCEGMGGSDDECYLTCQACDRTLDHPQ